MSRFTFAAIACLAAAATSAPAPACRVFRPPERRIEDVYKQRKDVRVALVAITQARHLSTPITRKLRLLHPDYEPPWRASASVLKMLVGEGSPEILAFDRGWGSAACDDGTPMPREGDRWIVYFVSNHPIEAANVLESYPLNTALRFDPQIRGAAF